MQAGLLATYQNPASNRSGLAWGLSALLLAFYVLLYFGPLPALGLHFDLMQRSAEALHLGSKWTRQARATYRDADVPGTGDRVTYLTPGLSTRVGRQASLYGYVALPIQRYVNDEQLAPRWGYVLGVSRTF